MALAWSMFLRRLLRSKQRICNFRANHTKTEFDGVALADRYVELNTSEIVGAV